MLVENLVKIKLVDCRGTCGRGNRSGKHVTEVLLRTSFWAHHPPEWTRSMAGLILPFKRWRFLEADPGNSTFKADLAQSWCVHYVLCTGFLGRTGPNITGNSSPLDPTQGYGI